MGSVSNKAEQLQRKIVQAEKELQDLRKQLAELESPTLHADVDQGLGSTSDLSESTKDLPEWKWPLREEEYLRYGRQLILPTVGIKGQLNLKSTAVLIVGAGGLGCPAAAYLAGAGVGTLGIVDGDTVEMSNLHRQIAHSTSRVGMMKVDSLIEYCNGLNPEVAYAPHREHLTPQNAESIVSKYDLVLDCTDHPTSRYLISDICVLLQKTLVSASALRTDGQLIVLNNPPAAQGATDGGPCYRCVFPKPPPADSVVSCGEGGILGPVVGVMGVLQALEAIKLIAAGTGKPAISIPKEPVNPSLLLFSATSSTPFRSIRMRSRRPNCFACSPGSTLTLKELNSGSLDYVQFCGVTSPVNVLKPEERITAKEYNDILAKQSSKKHLLLDVREREHFNIASIPGAINVPFSTLQSRNKLTPNDENSRPEYIPESLPDDAPIFVVCRVGNDSQLATQRLKEMGLDGGGGRFVGDIKGGMLAWKHEVDKTLPFT
ncbi:adenylyltransferase [Annulohypoxylon maeteangense]|uniref:adenylyltransferase n=1 Tax=Annulohypoxylon maeteangense TaxID=1927788 RepID=UPI0020078F77|nr:adenylyltransferase [Annulohypoxylon maeteangense]KAI0890662.1 adenylyltransferase [Annulohypoxylon maeteangense]